MKIKLSKKTGFAYFPRELHDQFGGEMDALFAGRALVLVAPGSNNKQLVESLRLIIKSIEITANNEQ